jgi:hypothetical protein
LQRSGSPVDIHYIFLLLCQKGPAFPSATLDL